MQPAPPRVTACTTHGCSPHHPWQARFLPRAEFAKDPAELHRRTAALGCLTIAEQEEQRAAATKEAAEEAAALRGRAALRARAEAEAAQAWWVAQAATGGAEERARMRRAQSVPRSKLAA